MLLYIYYHILFYKYNYILFIEKKSHAMLFYFLTGNTKNITGLGPKGCLVVRIKTTVFTK